MGRDFGPAFEHSGKIGRLFYPTWSVSNVEIVPVNTKEIIQKILVGSTLEKSKVDPKCSTFSCHNERYKTHFRFQAFVSLRF